MAALAVKAAFVNMEGRSDEPGACASRISMVCDTPT